MKPDYRRVRPARLLASLFLVAGLHGLAHAEPERDAAAPAAGPVEAAYPAQELTPQILYQLMLAELAGARGQVSLAAQSYLDLARRTRDARIARRAAELAVFARQADLVTEAARLWLDLDPGSERAQQLTAGFSSPLSFPSEGYTLALDFKVSPKVFALLDELDKIVLDYGGRLYLTKDARMTSATIHQAYTTAFSHSAKFQSLQSNHYNDIKSFMGTLLLLGSNADVGQACAYRFAKEGYNILLATRTIDDYQKKLASDIDIRHNVKVENVHFDALQTQAHKAFYESLSIAPDVVVSVFGYLGNHEKGLADFEEAQFIIDSNFTGNVSILGIIANAMEAKKQGSLVCVSSVAGERGRKSNYLYGASKAALTAFFERITRKNVCFKCACGDGYSGVYQNKNGGQFAANT